MSALILRALIAGFSLTLFAVLNGKERTAADAGHAVGTIIPPTWLAILHADIVQGTGLLAETAAAAGIGGVKGLGLDHGGVEHAVGGGAL